MAKKDFIFFWGGTFSQWCPSIFTIDGVTYTSCEQYMMAKKALMFGDGSTYLNIIASKSPKEQKALGRTVKGFDKHVWEANCRRIVYDANYAKFTQNPAMYAELMATGTKEIVEASPEDFFDHNGIKKHYVTLYLAVTDVDSDNLNVQNLEPNKCEGWKWVDVRELPDTMFCDTYNVINGYLCLT